MMPLVVKKQAPIPPPSYQRAQARLSPALHIDALTGSGSCEKDSPIKIIAIEKE